MLFVATISLHPVLYLEKTLELELESIINFLSKSSFRELVVIEKIPKKLIQFIN